MTVADQQADPDSMLHLTRGLLALRRDRADLRTGVYAPLPAPEGWWAWRRGASLVVALNLTGTAGRLDLGGAGRVLVGTDRCRDGECVAGALELAGHEGVLVELG
jgi:alpha-glucosidase